jgi:hypothetical protein
VHPGLGRWGAYFRTDRLALPSWMSGSASGGVAVRASSPNQGAFRRRFVSALATQETRISGTSSAVTNRPRFERPCRHSRRLSRKNHRNPFSRSDPPSQASQPEKQPQPPLSAAAILPSPAFTGSVALRVPGCTRGRLLDDATSEQATLRFRSWHHRLPGHTGKSFPTCASCPSERESRSASDGVALHPCGSLASSPNRSSYLPVTPDASLTRSTATLFPGLVRRLQPCD